MHHVNRPEGEHHIEPARVRRDGKSEVDPAGAGERGRGRKRASRERESLAWGRRQPLMRVVRGSW